MTRLLKILLLVPCLLLAAERAGAQAQLSGQMPSLAPMLSQVTPAVVNISVLQRDPSENNPLLRDPFFRRFFNIPDSQSQPQQSAGSGVIIDAARGLVITNNHVIRDAQQIIVTLKDRRHLKATLVGTDPGTDIALLRVPPENLTAIRQGDSDQLSVGDYVVAIGNPFGIGQTVTSGIVSALGRSGLGLEGYEDFIQTDASINPGNSGGPLVDVHGSIVGINTAIAQPGSKGIGFAIPSNTARRVCDEIIRDGSVESGFVGIQPEDPPAGSSTVAGAALVRAVIPNGPADQAGIKAGDLVVSFDGERVAGSTHLSLLILNAEVGGDVVMEVVRGDRKLTFTVRVGQQPSH